MIITDFRNHLKIAWEHKPSSGVDSMRQFAAIQCRHGLVLSIQASAYHYCFPRETLDDLSQYESWEIALIRRSKPVGSFNICGRDRPVHLLQMLRKPKLRKFFGHFCNDNVQGYIPTAVVQQILDTLRR